LAAKGLQLKNPIAVLVIVLLIMVALDPRFTVQPVMSAPATITVPDDYPTIQEAINNASDGSTIFVRAGTYPEHLTINKPLSLIGEDRNRTIIDAEGKIGLIVSITSDYTRIEGFTFHGAGGTYYGYDGVLNFSSSNNIITNNIITNNELCGIALDSSHNNSIVHNDIINNFNGILLTNSTDNIISGNTIIGDSRTGILLYGASNNMIVGNSVSHGDSGITLMDYEWYDFHCSASNNSLINNTLTGNFQGISIYASPYNIMRNNTLNENYYSLQVSWYMYADNKVSYFIQDIDESNTIDGRPILYLVNHHNERIESNATYVAAVNCTNLTIKNLQLHGNNEGIVIAGTESSTFQNLNVTHNSYGTYLFKSNNNTIYGCNVVGGQVGIALESSWHNHIDHNNVTNTYGEGIILTYSNWNNITYNNLSNNKYRGILAGLGLENTIAYNTVQDNRMAGIGISSDGKGTPEHNIVHHNNIINNTCGVQLGDTSSNLIYNNNFVNNKQQASVSVSYGDIGYGNVWDNGYSSGGNYWSDYNGTDADHDGIGDTPYIIDASNTDHYPLMVPYVIPEFPTSLILPLFFMATLLAVTICKRKHAQND
jgi:parallel beta-helix repeat protein